jgi:hypothetical protein
MPFIRSPVQDDVVKTGIRKDSAECMPDGNSGAPQNITSFQQLSSSNMKSSRELIINEPCLHIPPFSNEIYVLENHFKKVLLECLPNKEARRCSLESSGLKSFPNAVSTTRTRRKTTSIFTSKYRDPSPEVTLPGQFPKPLSQLSNINDNIMGLSVFNDKTTIKTQTTVETIKNIERCHKRRASFDSNRY